MASNHLGHWLLTKVRAIISSKLHSLRTPHYLTSDPHLTLTCPFTHTPHTYHVHPLTHTHPHRLTRINYP